MASQPKGTAACRIEWCADGAVPHLISDRLTDRELIKLMREPAYAVVGIDAPFGWPLEFVQAVRGWSESADWPISVEDPERRQDHLVLRETDREVLTVTAEPFEGANDSAPRRGKRPLSVSTDKLAYTAMRCARLLAELGRLQGRPVDRAGEDGIVEVYPDAALREWGLWPKDWDQRRVGYKGRRLEAKERRARLVADLRARTGSWLSLDDALAEACVHSDDRLDALLSAMVARAVEIGESREVPDRGRASPEGWIHLPRPSRLSALVG